MSDVEKCAATLEYLVKQGLVPGLLPEKVTEAARLLRAQEKELATLRAALTTKRHIVEVEVEDMDLRKEVVAKFIIADPRIYWGAVTVDPIDLARDRRLEFVDHTSRRLVRVGTAEWLQDLEQQLASKLNQALTPNPD